MNLSTVPLIIFRDPRYLFIGFFSLFIYHSLTSAHFARSVEQIGLVMLCCFLFDALFKYIFDHRSFPLSALVSSLGIFVIIETKYLIIYPLVAFLTISSKYFLTIKGRHIFNPNNFAIVVSCLGLPGLITPGGSLRWGGDLNWSMAVTALGLLLSIRAQRVFVSIGFIVVFFVGAAIRSYLFGYNILLTAGILLSPGLLIFTYFMITDPKTSPRRPLSQLLFGATIAIFDHFLMQAEVRMSFFVSLFMVTCIYAFFRSKVEGIENPKNGVWGEQSLI